MKENLGRMGDNSMNAGSRLRRSVSWMMLGNIGASALIGILVLILPRFIPVEAYGHWQLYLFYATYLGYVSLGIGDGLYLRFSGTDLSDLPKSLISAHFRFLLPAIIISMALLAGFALLVEDHGSKLTVFLLATASNVFYILRVFITFVYQAANHMEVYAKSLLLERTILLGGTFLLIALGITNVVLLLSMDLVARILGFLFTAIVGRKIIFAKPLPWNEARSEIWLTFLGGIFLSLSSFATVLVPGIARWAANVSFGIAVFAQIALAFSLVNMFQTVLNSISQSLLPSIRAYQGNLQVLYVRARDVVSAIMLSAFVTYPVLKWAVMWWLPDYKDLPIYLAVLFPLLLTEAKSRLLAVPILQSQRKEKALSAATVASLAVAIAVTWVTAGILKNALWTVLSLTIAVTFRAVVLESMANRALKLPTNWKLVMEVSLSVFFLWATVFHQAWYASLIFVGLLLVYLGVTIYRQCLVKKQV